MFAANPDLSAAEVARRFGVSASGAWKVLHPDRAREMARRADADGRGRARRRRSEERNRGECSECGGPMGLGAVWRGVERCRSCSEAAAGRDKWLRWRAIQLAWEDGLSMLEIADVLDTTRNTIGTDMARMRAAGWDLPRRKNWSEDGLDRVRNARRAA